MVEYKLPKLGVASSNLVARSTEGRLFVIRLEALEAGSIVLKKKEKKARGMDAPSRRGNFNRPSTICRTYGAGRNAWSILGLKFETVAGIEQKGTFFKGLDC